MRNRCGERKRELDMPGLARLQGHALKGAKALEGLIGDALLLMGVKLGDIRALASTNIL